MNTPPTTQTDINTTNATAKTGKQRDDPGKQGPGKQGASTQTSTQHPNTKNQNTKNQNIKRPGNQGAESRPEYLGVRQAGMMTGMSPFYWRRQALSGQVASVKLGKRLLIPRTEIERVVLENTRPRVQPLTTTMSPTMSPTMNPTMSPTMNPTMSSEDR